MKLMRLTNLNKRAFTLLEILLASIIFIISIGGIYATLSAVRKPVVQKERALTAAILGKQLLESLRSQVDARNIQGPIGAGVWTGNLAIGSHTLPPQSDLQGVQYNMAYTVICADGTATCDQNDTPRAVTLNITFNDAQ